MVDNEKYDDEYQFIDPEQGSVDPMDYSPESSSPPSSGEPSLMDKTFAGKSGVIRNVLIVVALTILVMVIYPLVNSSLSIKQKSPEIRPVIQESKTKEYVAPVTPAPVVATVVDKSVDEKVTQQLTTLESNQDRMQSEFVATNNQLNGISNNINDMMMKVTELNRMTALYASKIEEQARQIEQLTAHAEAQKKHQAAHASRPKMRTPGVSYYIQAVIPGRAWLMATNGSTLTVREGTVIAGLGRVTLIDPRQGRVVISSGRVIRFSQEDS